MTEPATVADPVSALETELSDTEIEKEKEKERRDRDARAQALTLEIVGDLPFAEVKPPENVLFVCKLNPVTEDADLELIFSRFGKILSCEVIRDKRTGDSLQYSFIEFDERESCEQAYYKMQGVLIDDHRIHVDFSQSVSRLSDSWRTATTAKRRRTGGKSFGGSEALEKRTQYRNDSYRPRDGKRYDILPDAPKSRQEPVVTKRKNPSSRSRSRSRRRERDLSRSRSRSPPPRRRQDDDRNQDHLYRPPTDSRQTNRAVNRQDGELDRRYRTHANVRARNRSGDRYHRRDH